MILLGLERHNVLIHKLLMIIVVVVVDIVWPIVVSVSVIGLIISLFEYSYSIVAILIIKYIFN